MSTFTGRQIDTVTINGVSDDAIHMSSGWSTGAFPEVHHRLPVGTVVDVESRGTRITGYRVDGTWIARMSDEELEEERIARMSDEELEEERQQYVETRAKAYADSLASQDIQAVLQQSVHGASVAGYIAGHRDAVREPEADRLRKMFRVLHGVEPTRAHHPVGAYLPVGQMDGDCSCGRGPWPCDTLRGETHG